ncbi:MAG: Crp/Fnr family transcriptional regulator [Pseudomonadota bacterium]
MFSMFSPSEREDAAQDCKVLRLAQGDMIFRAGEACEEFHFIITGHIKLYIASPSGQEKIIDYVGPGNSFAEEMMFLNKPHTLNAQALTDTMLVSVSKQAVMDAIARDARVAMQIMSDLSHRLNSMRQDIGGYVLQSGMQRLIDFLLKDFEGEDTATLGMVTVTLPVSKATIASRLSLTPEYFSRVLHELETAKIIEIRKREICILDAHRLASYGAH